MYVCMYSYMYVCMYVCMYVQLYVHMYVCMYVQLYVHMYVCHVCISQLIDDDSAVRSLRPSSYLISSPHTLSISYTYVHRSNRVRTWVQQQRLQVSNTLSIQVERG